MGRTIAPWRKIPEYKPFILTESARTMSFCSFQRIKFEALFDSSRAVRWRDQQDAAHPEQFRPLHPDPGSALRRVASEEETLEEKYS